MAITQPCYCTREDVKGALDFKETARINPVLDRGLQSAARNIDKQLHRRFFPQDQVKFFDWPNSQYAYPWRLWLDRQDLIVATSVQSPAGTAIPLNQVFAEPVNDGPPFTYLELDRSTVAAWGNAATPQHSIVVAGTWGYSAETESAGTLAAAVSSTSATTITVSDSSLIGVGDLLVLDYALGAAPYPSATGTAGALQPITGERVLVTGRAMAATSAGFTGPATASAADNVLAVSDGTLFGIGEVIQLDSERMQIADITGNNLILRRAWDGTILAAHTSGIIYAARQLTVARGQLGTTAAAHTQGAAISRHRPPSLIRDLAIAETLNRVLEETSGYAAVAGEGDATRGPSGAGLADMWDEAMTAYGRKNRTRVI